jgi:hypothetical protein
MATVDKISKNVFVLTNPRIETSIEVEFGDATYSDQRATRLSTSTGDHIAWGEKDQILFDLHKLASDSPNKWPLMKTRRDFLLGLGLQVVTRTIENGKVVFNVVDDEETRKIMEWLDMSNHSKLMKKKAMDLIFSGRYFLKVINQLDGGVKFEHIQVFHCRPCKIEVGESKISRYALNGNFGTMFFRKNESFFLPAFDEENPKKFAVSILDVKDYWTGMVYNTFGEWWGTKGWTEVGNDIPHFHKSGLKNGYNIKYHISIPDDYFVKEDYAEGESEETLKQRVLEEMGNALEGVENADKTLYTYHKVLAEGRYAESGVKITPLKNEMSDDAYTKLFNTANQVQATGHRTLPTLAGIDTGGKLGGSGKELEVSANYMQNYLTHSDRELLIEDLLIAKKILGWGADKFFKFENIEMYNFDTTPKGVAENQNQEQNQDNQDGNIN